jgi:hypothetical protein
VAKIVKHHPSGRFTVDLWTDESERVTVSAKAIVWPRTQKEENSVAAPPSLHAATIESSSGLIQIDAEGYPISKLPDCYKDIQRFDVERWRRYYHAEMDGSLISILELGYWMKDGFYQKPQSGEEDEEAPAAKDADWHYDGPNQQGARVIHVAEGEIAEVFSESFSEEEAEAHARLIVAAPRLLRALKLRMPWKMRDGSPCCCPAGEKEGGNNEPKKMPTVHASVCEDARAALAQVEG